MNILTVPRLVAKLEFKALRYPAQLLETKVVAAYLPQESGVRLAYERLLGALDSRAGALLADEPLSDRGRALSRRGDVLEKAAALEAKAQERAQQAAAELREQTAAAEAEKARIQSDHERKAQQLAVERAAAQKAVHDKAAAREKADKLAIDATVQATLAAERDRLDAKEAAVEARVAAATAAPKAQLSKASKDARTAQERRSDADRLASLAAQEKAARTS